MSDLNAVLDIIKLLEVMDESDQRREQQRIKSHESAIRWQGLQDYDRMIGQGYGVEEAMRANMPRIFYSHPDSIANMLKATRPKEQQYRAVPIMDDSGNVIAWEGPSGSVIRIPRPPQPRLDPMKKMELDIAKSDYLDARRQKSKLFEGSPLNEKMDAENRVQDAGKRLTELLSIPGSDTAIQTQETPTGDEEPIETNGSESTPIDFGMTPPALTNQPAINPTIQPPQAQYSSPDDVKRAYRSGRITRDQAEILLKQNFPGFE